MPVTFISFGTGTASSGSGTVQLILASELAIKMTEVLLGVMAPGTARVLPAKIPKFLRDGSQMCICGLHYGS